MKRAFQIVLLKVYRAILSTSILSTDWGRSVFDLLYGWYKRFIEVGNIRVLRDLVTPGSIVVDVGANIGYFTKRFARWIQDGGSVVAIEPEEMNFRRLENMVSRNRLRGTVVAFRAVAADATGTLKLRINPHHPGDHKIATEGVEVKAYALDDLLTQLSPRPVSLIKIDVQGAEEKVLAGAQKTLEKFRPALFIEIDDQALQSMDSSASAMFDRLMKLGYEIRHFRKGLLSAALGASEAIILCREAGYADFVFLHKAGG